MQIDFETQDGARLRQLVQQRLSGEELAAHTDAEIAEIVTRQVVDQL